MKKFLTSILISLVLVANLLAPISGIKINKAEAADCIINSAKWDPDTQNITKPDKLTLNISTTNCKDKAVRLLIQETNGINKNVDIVNNFTVTEDNFSIDFKPGEEACNDGVCTINYDLYLDEPNSIFGSVNKKSDTDIIYKCDKATCNDAIKWSHALPQDAKISGNYNFEITPTIKKNSVAISASVLIKNTGSSNFDTVMGGTTFSSQLYTRAIIKNEDGTLREKDTTETKIEKKEETQTFNFNDLKPKTKYFISFSVVEKSKITASMGGLPTDTSQVLASTPEYEIETLEEGKQNFEDQGPVQGVSMTKKQADPMPACSLIPMKISGCIAQALYYALFIPTSYVFALTGTFFDYTFAYSVQDSSYKSAFVVQGWGLVRDFCNVFFIFVLLYIAIGTILDLHGFKTKETIINVIIIGLFINFSLFATQVIIDASNVMARVFYNSDSIKITEKGANGVANATPNLTIKDGGIIPLSAGIVNKVNPQNLIIHSEKINDVTDKGGKSSMDSDGANSLGAGSFIVIVLLATFVNVVGIIVFISVGLIFVTRVIGLWIAMILAPLAFFTYIIPSWSGIKMIGWKNWWSDTLKLAFLAPVFVFFMYIILKFLELDLIADPMNKDGVTFFIATLIPFAFIMILMMKAKSIASDMSGEMGKQITGGVAAAGGMILGGAALGTAFLGRRVVGAGLARVSRLENATPENLKKRADLKNSFNQNLAQWKAQDPNTRGAKPKWEDHVAQYNQQNPNDQLPKMNVLTRLGASLNKTQKHVGDVDHARHEIDETKKSAGLVDVKGNVLDDSQLTGQDLQKLKGTFAKNKRSDFESYVRRGVDGKGKDIFITDENNNSYKGEEAYKAARRRHHVEEVMDHPEAGDLDDRGELTDAGRKKVENKLNSEFNARLKVATDGALEHEFDHLRTEAKESVNILTRGFARANKGSYDVRNISQVKSDKRDGLFGNVPTKLIAGIALGVRTGLKSSGVNHGQGQADIFKDLGNTITEALKGVKIEVPKGGGGGHDNHGGGHDTHGGDHGGHH